MTYTKFFNAIWAQNPLKEWAAFEEKICDSLREIATALELVVDVEDIEMSQFDHLVVEALVAAVRRLGRRTALTFPLLPPPQKN